MTFKPGLILLICIGMLNSYGQRSPLQLKTSAVSNKRFSATNSNIKGLATVTAAFTALSEVCINTPVQITNTSVGASNYYWGFCEANFTTVPDAFILGTPEPLYGSGNLSREV